MAQTKKLERSVLLVAVLGSLIFLNVIGVFVFGRLDLTADKQFTLSDATKATLSELKEPVTVRAYFTEDLPPPYATNARYVRDLLDEYYNHGDGNFRYEFIDPAQEETDEDKELKKDVKQDIFGRQIREATAMEKELQTVGVPPVQVRVNEADKLEVKRAYMGLAIHYGDKKEVIPVVQETAGLEYDLTTLVRKLTRERAPKIAFTANHGELGLDKELGRVNQLLSQNYDVTTVDLNQAIPDDVDAIVIAGPKTPFNDVEKKALDGFIMKGKGVAFLLDAVRPDLATLQIEELDPGLKDLLEVYGVQMQPGLVVDQESATISVTQQRGFMRVAQPVRYPFIPLPRGLDAQHPLTRGLAQVAFPFVSPLSVAFADGEGVKAETLVKTSPKSFIHEPPYNLDPMQEWTAEKLKDEGAKDLVVTVTGTLKSFSGEGRAQNGRVLVASGASFMTDQFFGKPNEALALNLMDWLVLDEQLLAVRSRGLSAAPLAEVSDGTRGFVKYANIVGLPFAFVCFGLVRWRMREKRRSTAAV